MSSYRFNKVTKEPKISEVKTCKSCREIERAWPARFTAKRGWDFPFIHLRRAEPSKPLLLLCLWRTSVFRLATGAALLSLAISDSSQALSPKLSSWLSERDRDRERERERGLNPDRLNRKRLIRVKLCVQIWRLCDFRFNDSRMDGEDWEKMAEWRRRSRRLISREKQSMATNHWPIKRK